MGKMEKVSAKDFNNHQLEVLLLYNEDGLSFIKCRCNSALEEFLTGIRTYLTEDNVLSCIEFFFMHRQQKLSTKISVWISKNVTGRPPKRKKGANNQQYSWPPYERLVYLVGHYKNLQGINLDCRLNDDKTKVVLKLRMNAQASETYEENIVDNDIVAAKNKAAANVLKRLGF